MNLNNALGRLRLVAILEGISYLLLGITMPLKYQWNILEPNLVIGMLHGILFVVYVLFTAQCWYLYKWRFVSTFWVLLASLIPFGTFIVDKKILQPAALKRNNP